MVASKLETLSIGSLKELFNLRGLYVLGYGMLFGMCEQTSSSRAQGCSADRLDSNLGDLHRRSVILPIFIYYI